MGNSRRRWIANVMIVLGAILLLAVAGYIGWSQVSAARLRAELRAAPTAMSDSPTSAAAAKVAGPPTQEVTQSPTPTTEPTTAPSPTAPPPTVALAAAATPPPTVTPASMATRAATATRAETATRRAQTPTTAPTGAAPQRQGPEPVRLAIPDLKIDAKVVPMGWEVVNTAQGPVSQWVIPKDDGGHHINSARIGEPGNLVISGHNNIYARVFLNISQAWDNASRTVVDDFTDRSDILSGRVLTLYDAAGNSYQYRIRDFYRVRDTGVSFEQRVANGRFMLPTEEEQVTIITCWPPTNNTHRLVVIAEPAP